MTWERPPGPPKVWEIIKIVDSNGSSREISIQEIPEGRYEEAIDHMSNIFVREEVITSSFNLVDDIVALTDFQNLWRMALEIGISVAAYDITEDSEKSVLAGVNVLAYGERFEEKLKTTKFYGEDFNRVLNFVVKTSDQVDPKKLFGVEGYLGAFGLSVDPRYRKLGLGKKLLQARDYIGREYNIPYTSTLFTGVVSQKVAAQVGFQELLVGLYGNALDEEGQKVFPESISEKTFKIMGKHISS